MATELWGVELYGDPCHECGFDWSISTDDAIGLVAGFSDAFGELVAGSDGSARIPDLAWSASGYISLWSLEAAAVLWEQSVRAALAGHVVLNHASVGRMTTADVIRATSHDGSHHVWDVQRITNYAKR